MELESQLPSPHPSHEPLPRLIMKQQKARSAWEAIQRVDNKGIKVHPLSSPLPYVFPRTLARKPLVTKIHFVEADWESEFEGEDKE
jgi:hypothetical protein